MSGMPIMHYTQVNAAGLIMGGSGFWAGIECVVGAAPTQWTLYDNSAASGTVLATGTLQAGERVALPYMRQFSKALYLDFSGVATFNVDYI